MDCGLSPIDIQATANELYRRMEQPAFASDDAYWSSLPQHLRNFIRNALPLAGNLTTYNNTSGMLPGGVGGAGGQRAMYAMAQHIVGVADREVRNPHINPETLGQNSAVPLPSNNYKTSNHSEHQSTPGPNGVYGTTAKPDVARRLDDGGQFRLGRKQLESLTPSPTSEKKRLNLSQSDDTLGFRESTSFSQRGSAQTAQAPIVNDSIPSQNTPMASQSPESQRIVPVIHQQSPVNAGTAPSSRAAGKQPMQPIASQAAPALPQQQGSNPTRSARSAGKAPITTTPTHGPPSHSHSVPHLAAQGKNGVQANPKGKTNAPATSTTRVWQSSTMEERERIRAFWFGLTAEDRRKLVRTEKDSVLKRIKDHQRHSCSCAICSRKKITIEDELDRLYEAYAQELDVYGHTTDRQTPDQDPSSGPGPFPGSVQVDEAGNVLHPDYLAPAYRTKLTDDPNSLESDEEYDDDEDYEEDEEDENVDDEDDVGSEEPDPPEDDYAAFGDRETPRTGRTDSVQYDRRIVSKHVSSTNGNAADQERDFLFFQGDLSSIKGVLTVADDLLRNEGQRFLEMMEQFAERRTTRPVSRAGTNDRSVAEAIEHAYRHDQEDTDLDEGFSDQTEEVRRMFQIFAARTFEQRVLQAYLEQVAQQKQLQFLKELEDEENAAEAREARKAKEAQKKKDKRKLQKQAKEDEKAKREAAAAAAEAELRLKQLSKERELNRRREDERLRREAERRARLTEQARKDVERQDRSSVPRPNITPAAKHDKASVLYPASKTKLRDDLAQVAGARATLGPISDTGDGAASRSIIQHKAALSKGESDTTQSIAQVRKTTGLTPLTDLPSAIKNNHESIPKPNGFIGSDPKQLADVLPLAPIASHEAASSLSETRGPMLTATIHPKQTFTRQDNPAALQNFQELPLPITSESVQSVRSDLPTTSALREFNQETSFINTNQVCLPRSGSAVPSPIARSFPAERHDPIGPIQPIGRPRPFAPSDGVDGFSSSIRPGSSLSTERVLGSAALSSGDDEVILPTTRRVSHTAVAPVQPWNTAMHMNPPSWHSPYTSAPKDIWNHVAGSSLPANQWSTSPSMHLHGSAFSSHRYESAANVLAPPEVFSRMPTSDVAMPAHSSQMFSHQRPRRAD